MSDRIKIKYWWSEDKKWFCILTDDGNNQSTVSLTVEEASLLSMNAVLEGPGIPAQGAWMPIESAPKPNVDVMLWYPWASAPCKGAPAGFRYIARWTGTDSGEDCWRDPVDFEPIGDAPTHWQPLPDGPSVPSTTLGGAA